MRRRWPPIIVLDGFALAVLLVILFIAETFNAARGNIQSVAEHLGPAAARAATPVWLHSRWAWLIAAGVVFGVVVIVRFVVIARDLDQPDRAPGLQGEHAVRDVPGGAGRVQPPGWMGRARQLTPLVAGLALALWVWWQWRARAVVGGVYDISTKELVSLPRGISMNELVLLHLGAVLLALVALGLGGAVVGDATLATRRSSLVRLHFLFLLALYVVVFQASFLSDQLTDVLRAWGDGPDWQRTLSRPLAGLAAAVLLGAVVRASATRILLPPDSQEPKGVQVRAARLAARLPAREHVTRPSRKLVGGLLVIALALGALHVFAALVFAAFIVALLVRNSNTAAPPAPPGEKGEGGLRRLAGTMGVVPPAILLGGLTEASMNSLLLPSDASATDRRLLIWTGLVTVAVSLLAAHAHVVVGRPFDRKDRVRGEKVGGLALIFAALSAVSTTLAAVLLAGLAFVLASRRLGERGALELWAAWGVGLGIAFAVYARPVEVSRGLGGFAVALFGATAVLALLHPLSSLGARYHMGASRWHPPVILAAALWLAFAWASVPPVRNQVPTVDAAKSPQPLTTAVGAWLDDLTAHPLQTNRSYVPMVLVGASGGGSKAAYWTDLVLDCMLGSEPSLEDKDECPGSDAARDRYRSLFLTSSASGGSVGVYQLIRHHDVAGGNEPWIVDSTGQEVLSPLLAWGLFHDLPTFLLGAPTRPNWCRHWLSCRINADRATVQAAAVSGSGDLTVVASDEGALTAHNGPVTIFNTAQVHRLDPWPFWPRRRAVLSRVSLAESDERSQCAEGGRQPIRDAIDGHDLLPSGDDVTILSSAMLSARFPFLEPPGWLGSRSQGSDTGCGGKAPTEKSAKLRDGGTYDNTGMMTLVDLLDPIEDAIERWERDHDAVDVRIVAVSIDDDVPAIEGEKEHDPTGREPDDPDSRAAVARAKACAHPGVSYMRISPQPHVGAQAATGWEVSETSRQEDLVDSLRPTAGPGKRLHQLREMLGGTPLKETCLK